MNASVGERLKQIRMQHGLTQGQIGEILNRTAMFVCKVEKGMAVLTEEQIRVLCSSLGVREGWLQNGTGPMTEKEATRDRRSIGERVYQVRKEKKLSQAEFAKLLGVSRNTVSLLERRKINASPAIIRSVVERLDVDENWLRSGDRTDVRNIEEQLARDPEAREKIIDFLKWRYPGELG